MTFSSAAVASYNPFSGTFHEVRVNRPITVTPKDGELRSGSEGISPDEICGLYRPVFYAGLSNNPSDSDGPKKISLAASISVPRSTWPYSRTRSRGPSKSQY